MAVLLSLLLISLAAASPLLPAELRGPDCELLDLRPSDELEFREMPRAIEGRIPIPFSVEPQFSWSRIQRDDPEAGLTIYAGSGAHYNDNVFYALTLMRSSVLVEKLEDGGGRRMKLDSVAVAQLMDQDVKGFYFRLKVRREYTMVGLYEAGDDDATEPIISFKDTDPIMKDLTHFALAVRASSARSLVRFRVYLNCRVFLGQPCIHTMECVDHGTACQGGGEGEVPICDCDEDHIRSPSGTKCVDNPIKIGDPCRNSRECAKLDARCRRVVGTANSRTCQCFKTYFVDKYGICTEPKDRGELEFHRLNRAPTYAEVNPGRRPPPRKPKHLVGVKLVQAVAKNAVNDGSVRVQSHCAAHVQVSGKTDFPSPAFPRKYFPLPLNPNGFDLGLFVRGSGGLVLEFTHDGDPMSDSEVVFKVEIRRRSGFVSVTAGGRSKKALMNSVSDETRRDAFWVSLSCAAPTSADCAVLVGRAAESAPLLALESLPNPWLTPFQTATPANVAFLPASRDTALDVTALCTAGVGEDCSHDSDCRKAHRDLQCGGTSERSVCECWKGAPRWDKASSKCV